MTSKSIVELADIIEIIYRIAELKDISIDALEDIRLENGLNEEALKRIFSWLTLLEDKIMAHTHQMGC